MTAGADIGLPALLGQTPATHHHFVEIADVKFDVVQPAGNVLFLDQEQIVMIVRALRAQEARALAIGIGETEAKTLDVEVARAFEIRHVKHDVPEAARLMRRLKIDALVGARAAAADRQR